MAALLLALFPVLFFQTASARPRYGPSLAASKFSVAITPDPVRSMMQATGTTTVKVIQRPVAPPGLYYYRVVRKKTHQELTGRVVFQ